ncbi:PREDICTED: zinc finger protein 608 [Ceratosolen solmsi marchali]|uniref:Zinc finger protein 608 n=1 Tax=Ceratosolen solmsi marchali TaxID=326594 RepID=A0AAJ6YTC5_9HYME|nr:PREDICTED: zinc finger protein 608 [Ceratosolen solmsi marchali]
MAPMPLNCLSQFNSKCSFFNTYKQKYNLICESNLKKYLAYIATQHGFIFKYCKLVSSRKNKKEYNISTVAANASELDLVVANETSNFEYDDNEWDVGIGNLIIDLDADIEKTQEEKLNLEVGMASTPSTSSLNHQIQTAENLNSPCSDKSHSSSCHLSPSLQSSAIFPSSTCNINTQNHNLSNTNNSLELTITNCKSSSICNISGTNLCNKMAVEHSATVDKGLKMKIKRTKPGTKSNEIKHEIVKSNEVNGSLSNQDSSSSVTNNLSSIPISGSTTSQYVHTAIEASSLSSSNKSKSFNLAPSNSASLNTITYNSSKRTSGNHRREKGRDKHDKLQVTHTLQLPKIELNGSAKHVIQNNAQNMSSITEPSNTTALTNLGITLSNHISLANDQNINSTIYTNSSPSPILSPSITNFGNNSDQCDELTANASQVQIQRSQLCSRTTFQVTQNNTSSNETSNTVVCSSNTTSIVCSTFSAEDVKCSPNTGNINAPNVCDSMDTAIDSPPAKKSKCITETELKEMTDICVGTSIGTITEPDCLGPCEPGTSVTLEGIVWHETEGGVLVVNITWRGKTYVGTLLDCTRHDWAPPRFCDSPTSDLDTRSTKGRAKRGRTAPNVIPTTDLSNFTETRSSVHSKLRNTGNKGRRGAYGSPALSPGATAFISPRTDVTAKRKTRCLEEDDKSKQKIPPPTPPNLSPPASPTLLECSEPNCSKKYKHIDGLKYHKSHAHGLIDDDDMKEIITSLSENDESNIESPSPLNSAKSPSDKIENVSNKLNNSTSANILEALPVESSLTLHITLPNIESQSSLVSENNIKPAILRYKNEDCTLAIDPISAVQNSQTLSQLNTTVYNPESPNIASHSRPILNKSPSPVNANVIVSSQLQPQIENSLYQTDLQLHNQPQISQQLSTVAISSLSTNRLVQPAQQMQVHTQCKLANSNHIKNHQLITLASTVNQHGILNNISNETQIQTSITNQTVSPGVVSIHDNLPTHLQSYSNSGGQTKIPQFKVKPTAALMPEEDKDRDLKTSKIANFKKKIRKSPINSPHASPLNSVLINTGRDDVQSPAYSDISDDTIPAIETNTSDKLLKENQDKDIKSNSQTHLTTHFTMYPYYGQPSYLIQNIQDKSTHEYKMNDVTIKNDLTSLNVVSIPTLSNLQNLNLDKNKKEARSIPIQELPESQTQYYTNYNAYISSTYPFQTQSSNSQNINHLSEIEFLDQKHKIKQESQSHNVKEKHLENQQMLKESMEIKNQMSPYQLYNNSNTQQSSPTSGIISDDSRYYIYSDEQRRKENSNKHSVAQKSSPLSPKHQSKQEKSQEINKSDETKIKQEGVKPTMETQGPPPPPTSQYAYIHPGYIPSHHYSSISYDTGHHGIYRNLAPMIVPGTYTSNPYLHQLPRYHSPEDLSRSPGGKALDLLQHHANQYYSNHKIHELQERALKSPIPKTSVSAAGSSPLAAIQSISIRSPIDPTNNSLGSISQSQCVGNKQQSQNLNQQHQQQQHSTCADPNSNSTNKDNRSPPPQRHVHTHHHTHVGLGYPILPGQYSTPYGEKSPKQWENGFGVDF